MSGRFPRLPLSGPLRSRPNLYYSNNIAQHRVRSNFHCVAYRAASDHGQALFGRANFILGRGLINGGPNTSLDTLFNVRFWTKADISNLQQVGAPRSFRGSYLNKRP